MLISFISRLLSIRRYKVNARAASFLVLQYRWLLTKTEMLSRLFRRVIEASLTDPIHIQAPCSDGDPLGEGLGDLFTVFFFDLFNAGRPGSRTGVAAFLHRVSGIFCLRRVCTKLRRCRHNCGRFPLTWSYPYFLPVLPKIGWTGEGVPVVAVAFTVRAARILQSWRSDGIFFLSLRAAARPRSRPPGVSKTWNPTRRLDKAVMTLIALVQRIAHFQVRAHVFCISRHVERTFQGGPDLELISAPRLVLQSILFTVEF